MCRWALDVHARGNYNKVARTLPNKLARICSPLLESACLLDQLLELGSVFALKPWHREN